MNFPSEYDIEQFYLNLTIEERVEFSEVKSFLQNFGWDTLERRLLAEHWVKYGYLARKIQEKK
jgi:hypothetical protein